MSKKANDGDGVPTVVQFRRMPRSNRGLAVVFSAQGCLYTRGVIERGVVMKTRCCASSCCVMFVVICYVVIDLFWLSSPREARTGVLAHNPPVYYPRCSLSIRDGHGLDETFWAPHVDAVGALQLCHGRHAFQAAYMLSS